jgi:hypothetical protein
MNVSYEKVSDNEIKIIETAVQERVLSVSELNKLKQELLERINIVRNNADLEVQELQKKIADIDKLLLKAKELGINY